jgi:hypothetical protein
MAQKFYFKKHMAQKSEGKMVGSVTSTDRCTARDYWNIELNEGWMGNMNG